MAHLFFAYGGAVRQQPEVSLDASYCWEMWHPTPLRPLPPPPRAWPSYVWLLMHVGHIFRNRDYSVLAIKRDARTAHRSFVFPGFFRFPFMAAADLQVGDTWTAPGDRGRGLATFALQQIISIHARPGRRLWYVTDESNEPSIRVVERAGFEKVGVGRRTKKFGLRLLGQFVIDR